jgi:hypothetical protein
MASKQELQVQQKRELETKEEATIPARTFLPTADIFETEDAFTSYSKCQGSRRTTSISMFEKGS